MFGILNRRGIPPRHRTAAFMNLAYQKPVTKSGTWNQAPVGYELLTNGDKQTLMGTAAIDNTGTDAYLEIDLGREYEVYEIVFHSHTEGFQSAAVNTGDIELKTVDGAGAVTARDTQTGVVAAYSPVTLTYKGNGIPVQKVRLVFTPDGTRPLDVNIAEIEVFGC